MNMVISFRIPRRKSTWTGTNIIMNGMNQTESRSSKLQAEPDILVKFFNELRSWTNEGKGNWCKHYFSRNKEALAEKFLKTQSKFGGFWNV